MYIFKYLMLRVPDRCSSVCLLGVFLDKCRRRFCGCSRAIQSQWYSCPPRTCRTTSLDHCSHLHTRIRHLLVHLDLLHKTFSDRMLCDSHHQPRLLRSNSFGMLFDMPTFRLQLGSVHSRNMWRREVLGSIHCSVQPVDGHRNRLVTFTRFVGASDAD